MYTYVWSRLADFLLFFEELVWMFGRAVTAPLGEMLMIQVEHYLQSAVNDNW
jgi:hypothetical protein